MAAADGSKCVGPFLSHAPASSLLPRTAPPHCFQFDCGLKLLQSTLHPRQLTREPPICGHGPVRNRQPAPGLAAPRLAYLRGQAPAGQAAAGQAGLQGLPGAAHHRRRPTMVDELESLHPLALPATETVLLEGQRVRWGRPGGRSALSLSPRHLWQLGGARSLPAQPKPDLNTSPP